MTDAKLATLRAGCQQGEMPAFNALADYVGTISEDWWHPIDILRWNGGRYLDALAALQEALWPGSVMECLYNQTHKVWIRGRGAGHDCPTLATAWLDAILAGLMEKDDG